MTLVFIQKIFGEFVLVKSLEVHAQKSNFIQHIDLSELIIEFNTIKKNRFRIQEDITGVKVAMNVPLQAMIDACLHPASVLLQKGITPFDRGSYHVAKLTLNLA